MIKKTRITSFDKTESSFCACVRPEKYDDIFKIRDRPIIARGAGLSYCNAGAVNEGVVVDMTRMNKILFFDNETGVIRVESGMTIGDLNNFAIAHGWMFPVLPGYPTITIGGCIAFNIHGKSQFNVGTFGDWVTALNLYHPDHGEIICSASENSELFDLTIGGMGLTGIILSAELRLKKLPGGVMQVERQMVASVYDAVEVMQQKHSEYEFVYSWNNLNCTGRSFGKGVVYLEKFHPGKAITHPYSNKMTLGFKLPPLHNKFTVRTMCSVYYLMESLKKKKYSSSLSRGSFPIYHKEIYYYLFGKKGFREYQVIFPSATWKQAFGEIETLLHKNKYPVALGSLKLFNGKPHHLNFNGEGVCLTIDVQESSGASELFSRLDEITLRNKGIFNLCKDSRITAGMAEQIFPEYNMFKQKILRHDSKNTMRSELKNRILTSA